MKKYLIILLLLIPNLILSQNWMTDGLGKYISLNGAIVKGGGAATGGGGEPPEGGTSSTTGHRISHDQEYIIHDEMANSDDVGQVYVNVTDSIFNDRRSGSFSYSIITGNTGTAFSISSSGMIEVADYTEVDQNFTLGVEVAWGVDKDTIECTMRYMTNCIFIDWDYSGTESGTRTQPYNDYTSDVGTASPGTTYLFKRGTSTTSDYVAITENQWGDSEITYAAYGVGARPEMDMNFASGVKGFRLGSCYNVNSNDSVNTWCSHVSIYDFEISDIDDAAIECTNNSYDIEIRRVKAEGWASNGILYWNPRQKFVSGVAQGEYISSMGIIEDCEMNNYDTDPGEAETQSTGFKLAAGGLWVKNVWSASDPTETMLITGFRFTDIGYDSLRYFRFTDGRNGLAMRSDHSFAEWGHLKDNRYWACAIIETDHYNNWCSTDDILVQNVYIENASRAAQGQAGVMFLNWSAVANDHLNDATIRNIFIDDSQDYGIYIGNTGSYITDNVQVYNCLVTNSTDQGLYIGTNPNNTKIYNSIFYGNGTYDVDNDASSEGIFRNNIYQTLSGTFATSSNNYDYDTGDPFVGNGDYQTAPGITSVIDQGYDLSQTEDILENEITTQDIGAFEYGGTNYNWTDLDPEIYLCGIGNSIIDDPYDDVHATDGYTVNNLADPGDNISQQQTLWNALGASTKLAFEYVVIQVGVNDIASDASYATMVSRYESLLSDINDDISSSCKVIMFTMTPWGGSTMWNSGRNTITNSCNTWIMTEPTGVDLASSDNWDDLEGITDYLHDDYDSGDNIHPNTAGEAIIEQNIKDAIATFQ